MKQRTGYRVPQPGVMTVSIDAAMSISTHPMQLGISKDGLAESTAFGSERPASVPAVDETGGLRVRSRFWVSAALTLPLLILASTVQARGSAFDGFVSPAMAGFLALALATPVVFWGGWPLLVGGWRSIAMRKPTLIALVGFTVAVTYISGVIATLFPKVLATFLLLSDGLPAVYFTAAAVVTSLALLGRFLELGAESRMSVAVVGRNLVFRRNGRRALAARRSRGSIQEMPDAVSGVFVAVVVTAAAATFIVWSIWGPEPAVAYAVVNTVVVLIIACPCALGLAKPASFAVVAARAADAGIQFESAAAVEAMSKVDTLVIDKKSVLAEDPPRLVTVEPANLSPDLEFLRLAASLEQASEHPLASVIVAGARERGLDLVEARGFEEIPGMGVHGTVQRCSVMVGNHSLVESRAALSEKAETRAGQLCADGQSVLFVAVDGVVVGLLGVANPLKSGTSEAVRQLHAEGISVVMITGDRRATAEVVAHSVGFNQVHAEVPPDEEIEVIQRIQNQGGTVAMTCDAINNESAFPADVGIETGGRTDGAPKRTGVTLANADLGTVLRAYRLSRATVRNVRENFLFALIYTSLGLPFAAGALYPAFGVLLSPWIAVAVTGLGSALVIGNALQSRYRDLMVPSRRSSD